MKTAYDICQNVGIVLASYKLGQHNTICTKCSAYRKPQNRKKKCLTVEVDGKGVRWFCFNCEWSGYGFYDSSPFHPVHKPQYTGRVIERPKGRTIERPEKSSRVIERKAKPSRTIERPKRRTIDGSWV